MKRSRLGDVLEDHLICPITHRLPLDPVCARDGFVYERAAISEWLRRHPVDPRSPMTNETMGRALVSATSVQRLVRALVERDAFDDDASAEWKEVLARRARLETLRRAAEAGSPHAAMELGGMYRDGRDKNLSEAARWYARAAEVGEVAGAILYAGCVASLRPGDPRALLCLAEAAGKGSSSACYILGLALLDGETCKLRLPRDEERARYYLERAVALDGARADDPMRARARQWLARRTTA